MYEKWALKDSKESGAVRLGMSCMHMDLSEAESLCLLEIRITLRQNEFTHRGH